MALIVAAEDDEDIADLITAALVRAGHTVHLAPDGAGALDLIAEHRPDLVILDHAMPGMTGLEVARRLRADEATAGLPIMMLSANVPAAAPEVFDHVIRMPVSLSAVADAARDLIDGAPGRRPARPLTDPRRLTGVAALLGHPHPLDELDLTLAAAEIAASTGARTTAISLVLVDALLTMAGSRLPDLVADAGSLPAEWTPCGTVAESGRPMLVPDLAAGRGYGSSPLVVACGIRAYAGVPLIDADGMVVGTICAMDPVPGTLTRRTVRGLIEAAPQVMRLLNRRLPLEL